MKNIDLQTIDDRVDPLYFDESRKYKYINDDYEQFEKSKKVLFLNYKAWREISQHLIPHYNLMSTKYTTKPELTRLRNYLDNNILNDKHTYQMKMSNQIRNQIKSKANKLIEEKTKTNKFCIKKQGTKKRKQLFSTASDLSKRIISEEDTELGGKTFVNRKLDLSKLLVNCIHAYDQGTRDFSELSKKLRDNKKEINKMQELMICNLNNNIEDMKIGIY